MRKTMPSSTDGASSMAVDITSPYRLRDLIVRQTQALEAHTEADDKWRATVMKMFDERLKEKDHLIDLIKQSCIRDEKDKVRWFRVACIALVAALLCAGVDVTHLVGLF